MMPAAYGSDAKSQKLAAQYKKAWQRYEQDPFNQSKIDNLYRALHAEADYVSLFTGRQYGYVGNDAEAADQYLRKMWKL